MMVFAHGFRGIGPGLRFGLPFFGPAFGFLLFAAVVTFVIIMLVRSSRRTPALAGHGAPAYHTPAGACATTDEALQIVRGRLARGEIDAEEYNRIVNALMGTTPPATS